MAVFIVLWPYLLTTKLKSVIRHNLGHSTIAPHWTINSPFLVHSPRSFRIFPRLKGTTVEFIWETQRASWLCKIIICSSHHLKGNILTAYKNRYHTRAIITRGWYIFYPIFEDHFFVFKEFFFQKMLALCMVSTQERFVFKSGLWWRAYGILFHKKARRKT